MKKKILLILMCITIISLTACSSKYSEIFHESTKSINIIPTEKITETTTTKTITPTEKLTEIPTEEPTVKPIEEPISEITNEITPEITLKPTEELMQVSLFQ